MPRQARIDAPGALYHVIVNGIERRRLFQDDQGLNRFADRLGTILTETATACYACHRVGQEIWVMQPAVSISLKRGEKLAHATSLKLMDE